MPFGLIVSQFVKTQQSNVLRSLGSSFSCHSSAPDEVCQESRGIAAPFTEWDSFLFTPPMVLYAQVFSCRSASENQLSCLTEEGPVCLDNKMLQNLAHSKDRCSLRLSAETRSLFCTNFFGYFFFLLQKIYICSSLTTMRLSLVIYCLSH